MKRRITFIHKPDDQFDPDQLNFQKDSLRIKSLKAAREERWTTSLSELPQEVCIAEIKCDVITEFCSRLALHSNNSTSYAYGGHRPNLTLQLLPLLLPSRRDFTSS